MLPKSFHLLDELEAAAVVVAAAAAVVEVAAVAGFAPPKVASPFD
jgi:hypothetical protein